jgi:dolichol-phosphate mannosyltransferase
MKLSVVIPAYNEAESLPETLTAIFEELQAEQIPHEILVVNDNSRDNTLEVLDELKEKMTSLTYVTNTPPNGFGLAVRKGLDHFSGDCVAIMMADLSRILRKIWFASIEPWQRVAMIVYLAAAS